jgi:CTP synthase
MTKFIFVTGSVISGIGKGTCSSSIGMIFKSFGFNVTAIKIDPYLNVDSGSMSPWQHGECYVLNDGTEADLDLGNYERFLQVNLSNCHSITSGKIYRDVIEKERRGDYLGATVQMVPHMTDYIQELLLKGAKVKVTDKNDRENDICLVELGGSIGDLEGLVFCEAIAQLTRNTLKENESCFVHLSYVPTIHGKEIKTKPTQHSIRTVRSMGIFPDFLILRSETNIAQTEMEKVSRMCQMRLENIICNPDTESVYAVPKILMDQNLHIKIAKRLGLFGEMAQRHSSLGQYTNIVNHLHDDKLPLINIGIVGKYTGSQDTYLSLIRSLEMASVIVKKRLNIVWISSELKKNDMDRMIDSCDSIIIPGGFGDRGIEGMIYAANKCRLEDKKLLGICLGFQIMCIEFARNVLKLDNANSTEFNKETPSPVITPVASEEILGGTMRLGSMKIIMDDSILYKRFRHRYGLNHTYLEQFMQSPNFKILGETEDHMISNISIGNMIGVQYHPEFGYQTDEVFKWIIS